MFRIWERTLPTIGILLDTDAFTLEKSHMNVHNVEKNLVTVTLLLHTNAFTLEKGHMNAQNVGMYLPTVGILNTHKRIHTGERLYE